LAWVGLLRGEHRAWCGTMEGVCVGGPHREIAHCVSLVCAPG
jgi:hypothetical protein